MKKRIFIITAALLLCMTAAVFTAHAAERSPGAAGDANAVQCDTNTHVAGDINGDRRVTNADLTRLMKYLAGDTLAVNNDALDVNGDGKVDSRDLSRLMKHLADPEVEIYGG